MTKLDEENVEVDHVDYDDNPKIDHGIGICQRFRFELSADFFFLEEPNGQYIDVADSFAPASPRFHHVLLLRTGMMLLSIVSLVLSIYHDVARFMWIGYLSYIGLVITIVYQTTACIVTFLRKYLTQPNADSHYEPSMPVKIMWFLYFLSVPLELMIAVSYWTQKVLRFFNFYATLIVREDKRLSFEMITIHGIIALMLLIDGNLIARIPLRIKHIAAIEISTILFSIWTIIHAFSGLGNGIYEGNLLYDVCDWKNRPITTLITFIIIVVVVLPIVFMLAWLLSLIDKGFKFTGGRRQLHEY